MTAHAPGDLLDGRYELTDQIGSGGMGTVFRAHDTRLDRTVAIKLLHQGRPVDENTRARLQAEARFAGALQHPGIVQVFDYGEEAGSSDPGQDASESTPYVVMQYVEGTPVSQLVQQRGALPPETVAALLDDVAQALVVAHGAGIVHRDLKPSNILLRESGRAVLVDFGVARSDTTEPLTETGQIIGSADYLSPEQVRGNRATPASDIYSLGIVAHQCLSGVSPFRRDTQAATLLARLHDDIPDLDPAVPPTMRALVRQMMAPDPTERPSATEVAEQVARLDQPTVVLPPMPVAPPAPTRVPRAWDRRRLVAIGATSALVLTIGAGAIVLHDETTPPAGAAALEVPSVTGDPVKQAARDLKAAGFVVVRRPVDGPMPQGEVVRQSPKPGPYDGEDPATVLLRVASGWVDLSDADLLGATYLDATATLTDLGLTATRVDQPSTTPVGTVLAAPDGRVRVGSPVTLDVATAVFTPPPAPASKPAPKPKPHSNKTSHKPKKEKKPKKAEKHGKKGH